MISEYLTDYLLGSYFEVYIIKQNIRIYTSKMTRGNQRDVNREKARKKNEN